MTQTEKFVLRLEALKEGERSLLRSLSGQDLDETLQGFDFFTGLWWPLRDKSPRAPERRSAWLVAKLYGAFPISHVSDEHTQLARVLGRNETVLQNEFERKRFRRRFNMLLQTPISGLEPIMQWALLTVQKAMGQRRLHGFDWVRLLEDLRLWVRGPDAGDREKKRRTRDIRDIWAEDYLKSVHQSERRTWPC